MNFPTAHTPRLVVFILPLLISARALPAPAPTLTKKNAQTQTESAKSTASSESVAQPLAMSAAASPDKARLGETFKYSVEIRDINEIRYELPGQLSFGAAFDVVKVDQSRQIEGAETLTRFDFQIALFDLGEQQLADFTLTASGPGGEKRLIVPGPKITGVGSLKDNESSELQEIMPPVDIKVPRYTALWVVAMALLAMLAGLPIYRYLRNRRPRKKLAPLPPPIPAHQRALQALDALQSEDLPNRNLSKEYYFKISEILRDYLGERYQFLALDMTTEELLTTLTRISTPGLDYARFETFCREADLVKYAKLPATMASCKAAFEEATRLVRATTPQVAQIQEEPRKGAA